MDQVNPNKCEKCDGEYRVDEKLSRTTDSLYCNKCGDKMPFRKWYEKYKKYVDNEMKEYNGHK